MANFGDTLKQARAHKGVTLKEAEQATRINRNHLAALEDEDFSALPPLIYQRGIVRNYALYLDLDPARILSLFEDSRGLDDTSTSTGVTSMPPVNMPSHWAPNFAVIAFAVALLTRSNAAGIAIGIGISFVEPLIFQLLMLVSDTFERVQEYGAIPAEITEGDDAPPPPGA